MAEYAGEPVYVVADGREFSWACRGTRAASPDPGKTVLKVEPAGEEEGK